MNLSPEQIQEHVSNLAEASVEDLDDLRDGVGARGADDDEARAGPAGARVTGDEHPDAARVHEVETAQVDDDLLAAVEPLVDELLELRGRGDVQLAPQRHVHAAVTFVYRHGELFRRGRHAPDPIRRKRRPVSGRQPWLPRRPGAGRRGRALCA